MNKTHSKKQMHFDLAILSDSVSFVFIGISD